MTTSTDSPRRVFEQLLAGICERRWDQLAALYDENAVIHHPHALPRPVRYEGRDQVHGLYGQSAHLPLALSPRNVVVHDMIDPEVIIAEFDLLGRAPTSGKTHQLSVVMVMRVRNGLIVSSHDYYNHAVFAEMLGELPALMARLDLVA